MLEHLCLWARSDSKRSETGALQERSCTLDEVLTQVNIRCRHGPGRPASDYIWKYFRIAAVNAKKVGTNRRLAISARRALGNEAGSGRQPTPGLAAAGRQHWQGRGAERSKDGGMEGRRVGERESNGARKKGRRGIINPGILTTQQKRSGYLSHRARLSA